jgi:hypothetical protein
MNDCANGLIVRFLTVTIPTVEIAADELAVFHADASIIDQIRHASRGIDLIVRTAGVRVFASMISTRSSSAISR